MKRTRLKAMAALSKYLLLLAIFLLAGYANAFLSLNQVAANQVRVNYLIWFKGANKPKSINLNGQTTNQRLEWDAELPNILSPKQGTYSLLQKQDAELPSKITILITQTTSNTSYMFEAVNGVNQDHNKIKVDTRMTFSDKRDSAILSESHVECNSRSNDSNGLWRSAEGAVLSWWEVFFHSKISFKQINKSLTHAYLVLFSSFYAIGTELKCGVHPHWVIAKSSSKQVGNIFFTQPQSAKAASKATAEMQASADSNKMPSIFELIVGSKQTYEMKPQQDLINFSLLKTISIARLSAQTHLVERIFETSNEFNQRLIVTFIKTNNNLPSSSSEGENHVLKRIRRFIVKYIYSSNSEGDHKCNIELIKFFGDTTLFSVSDGDLFNALLLVNGFYFDKGVSHQVNVKIKHTIDYANNNFWWQPNLPFVSKPSQLIVEFILISHSEGGFY